MIFTAWWLVNKTARGQEIAVWIGERILKVLARVTRV